MVLAVMGLCFGVDVLLLLGADRLRGGGAEPLGLVLGASLGAVYAGACLLPGGAFLGRPGWHWAAMGLSGTATFGLSLGGLGKTALYALLHLGAEGLAMGRSAEAIPAAVLCLLLLGEGPRQRQTVELCYGGRSLRLRALRDTGNTLRDPLTGERVLVVGAQAARLLTGLTRRQLEKPVETLASGVLPRLRLLPYRAVGVEGGMLLALRMEERLSGKSTLVAFAPAGLDGQVQALMGGMA